MVLQIWQFIVVMLAVYPDGSLRPTIELRGPDQALLAAATAPGPGQLALVQAPA